MGRNKSIHLRVIHQIHEMRDRPWALHEIVKVSDTAKLNIVSTFRILKMIARFKHSFNHKKYQVTKGWMDDEMENVRVYELATMVRKINKTQGQKVPRKT